MIGMLMVLALAQGQDFQWSGTLAAGQRLTVKNLAGDVRVEPASGRTASVNATRRAGRRGRPEDVEIRRVETAEGVTVCVIYPAQRTRDEGCDTEGRWSSDREDRNDTRVDFTIRLPEGAALAAYTVSGSVTGRGIRGTAEVRSVSGDVRLQDVAAGLVEAQTVSGSVELTDIRADEVVAGTVSGDVEFRGEIRPRGHYDLKTLSGDVVLVVPAGAGAEITGSTFSGSFSSAFPIAGEPSGRWMRRNRISGTIGDGSARIRVESFSGNVALRAAGS